MARIKCKKLTRRRQVKRTVKLVTTQRVDHSIPAEAEGFPMRVWDVNIYLVGPDGDDMPANCYEKATYMLHESFGKRQKQTIKSPPFRIQEQGWGEFDMQITLSPVGGQKGGEQTISHDLNFQHERYEAVHNVTFRNPKPDLVAILKESGPVGEANGAAAAPPKQKRKPASRSVDMEKLAEALPQLQEDDLLQIVQMVHDNKTEETYTKNDLENGEFHVDLYTLPDNLIKMLWDFTSGKVDMATVA
ncbi:transcription factor TFIIF complex subunit Tfg3 [Saxophila tyrrhenica]|uniref:Transcription factor TFIIF complex subunit Tfg3 n=1 Tax=Saxophila tyrrhenica TaxID=1690608 RepID=A0AAV9P8K0_9PEZI|nr:transcription factor TFIIF complex subunit Tfg3 [Saxophila tyrrhenica]